MTDWEQCYLDGQTPWDKSAPSPPLQEWVALRRPTGRALIPGCGIGHDAALLAAAGLDVTGLDVAPTAIARARVTYPHLAERFVLGDLFTPPTEWEAAFDWVIEHTCLCALPPALRADYERIMTHLLRPGGRLAGVWFIEPEMDPAETGPPFALPVQELHALFPPQRWRILEDAVPTIGYPGRVGRERLRVLERLP